MVILQPDSTHGRTQLSRLKKRKTKEKKAKIVIFDFSLNIIFHSTLQEANL